MTATPNVFRSLLLLALLVGVGSLYAQTPQGRRAPEFRFDLLRPPQSSTKSIRRIGFSLMPASSINFAATASGPNLPVVGSGTLGRLTKWTGITSSQSVIADSTIFEDKFGKVGIGTDDPTSRLTVVGMIETINPSGGIKFPDGTIQTTAALASVFHDASLMGNGTAASPLGVANGGIGNAQLASNAVTAAKIAAGQVVKSVNGLFDNVTFAAGSNITITPSGNTLTIASTGSGGGLTSVAHGATLTGNGTAGSPLDVAVPLHLVGADDINPIVTIQNNGSGSGLQSIGAGSGFGVQGMGGNSGGVGVIGTGGPTANGQAGIGVRAIGGHANGAVAPAGRGVDATGGNSDAGNAGSGVLGEGGTSVSGQGGAGVRGQGGDSTNGNPGDGVQGTGADSNGHPGGNGVVGTGGTSTNKEGGVGVLATGGESANKAGGAGVIGLGGNVPQSPTNSVGGLGVEGDGGDGETGGAGLIGVGGIGDVTGGDGLVVEAGIGPGARAASFFGNVEVDGSLNVTGTKNFRIDHPLDPQNKYLVHAAIESSEVLNVYSGNITTDGNGDGVVTLPAWFEAVNRDLRYQLTVIGTFAQGIVAQKVHGNRFVIKTNAPNVEVSWQVTGVRSDAAMRKHPLTVEVDKAKRERGHYLSPEAFDQPEEKGSQWARYPELMQQMKERREQAKQKRAQQ